MKYVMFKKIGETITHYIPIIFPNHLVHSDIAEAMISGPLVGYEVHSAGECLTDGVNCFGSSSTLGVKSDPQDAFRILMNDYGGCFE